MPFRIFFLCVVAVLSGCQGTPPRSNIRSNIDPPLDSAGVAKMYGSQIMRLPVSSFLKDTFTLNGPHHLIIRTMCDADEVERRDSGLYVVGQGTDPTSDVVEAKFNNDCEEQANCYCPTCSKLDMGPQAGTRTYDVYAFGNRRTPAFCKVNYSRTGDEGSQYVFNLTETMNLGGALVDVGPVARGSSEYFEVKSMGNEAGSTSAAHDTHMLLFDVESFAVSETGSHRSSYAPVYAKDISAQDLDPRIGPNISTAPGHPADPDCVPPCPSPGAKHFLLIGKESPELEGPVTQASQVETTVTVVRSPSNSNPMTATLSVPEESPEYACGSPLRVAPGRYAAQLRARSEAAYGDANVVEGQACDVLDYDNCSSSSLYRRGMWNFRGFLMKVEAQFEGDAIWSELTDVRTVSNGMFGCGESNDNCWQTISEDFEINQPSQVRICLANRNPFITLEGTWNVARTPAYSELKVATLNAHQDFKHGTHLNAGLETRGEYFNMSNLLATRGRLDADAGGVLELEDFAPFEWAADLIALQETLYPYRLEFIMDEAEKNSDLAWRYVYGQGKQQSVWGVDYGSYNSLVSHELLLRGGISGSMLPPLTEGCGQWGTTQARAKGQMRCESTNTADMLTAIVPGQVAVRRWSVDGANDVPIMAYSVIMEPSKGGLLRVDEHQADNRRVDLQSMIDVIMEHLAADPSMFNQEGSSSQLAANRILLMGDFNFYPHEFGEHRWFLRRLREEFGYAVDVAAADRDSYDNFYDMHSFRDEPYRPTDRSPPSGWQSRKIMDPPLADHLVGEDILWWGTSRSWPHLYPYWARTYHGETSSYMSGGDRHDAILLVGRGWADDDPVRKYVLMHTAAQAPIHRVVGYTRQRVPIIRIERHVPYDSPFALKDAGGRVLAVDIAPWGDDEEADVPNDSGVKHYKPQYDISASRYPKDTCTQNGCTAFESDHIPVGARLRVTGGSIQIPVPESLPTARILAPATDTNVGPGEDITFQGEGTDLQDGTLPDSALSWYSDIDRFLGTGRTLTRALSGPEIPCRPEFINHTITLVVRDTDGNEATHFVRVSVGLIC